MKYTYQSLDLVFIVLGFLIGFLVSYAFWRGIV